MFIDYLCDEVGFSKAKAIADVGAGTGKFTKLLLERNLKVYCVEPNNDMLLTAKEYLAGYPECEYINSPAENILLPDKSVDFVTAAQAFHWFDEERFKEECRRILRGDGKVVLVWNYRDSKAQVTVEHEKILNRYCEDFKGFSGGEKRTPSDNYAYFFRDGIVECRTFQNDCLLDEDAFIGKALSSSYSPRESDSHYADFVAEMRKLFAKHSKDGYLNLPNVTQSYMGRV